MASKRNIEARKAILEAWKREQELVSQGKGTRDWTPEQQKDILENGKAYDEDGKAFEGHHKKSVSEYPEYQGDINNIQFLSRQEHKMAHGGSFQNPTNGEYNPIANITLDYKDSLQPTTIIELSNPVIFNYKSLEREIDRKLVEVKEAVDKLMNKSSATTSTKNNVNDVGDYGFFRRTFNWCSAKIKKGHEVLCNFQADHPYLSVVAKEVGSIVTDVLVSTAVSKTFNKITSTTGMGISNSSLNTLENKVDNTNPKMISPNVVSEHKQRYHTKDGVITKNIAQYSRGNKK